MKKDTLLTGEIDVEEHLVLQIDYTLRDSSGNVLSKKDDVKGAVKFTAVTDTDETMEVCFKAKPLMQPRDRLFLTAVSLQLTKNDGPQKMNCTAEVENLQPIEKKFKEIEQLSRSVLQEFRLLIENERSNRSTNESTHFRVFYFSIVSIFTLLGLALWQVLYLRKFFKVKKLIE